MISVIVPIYNVEPYLQKCLDSLVAQKFMDVEFILIDDGSTDRSGKIAAAYADADPRFFVYSTANHGLSAARNLGIEKARGDWLMFVDSDDYVTPDFCETPYQVALLENADLVIFRSRWENEPNRDISVFWRRIKEILEHNLYCKGEIKSFDFHSQRIVYSRPTTAENISHPSIIDAETAVRYGSVVAWNKLYHRKLFNSIRYPEDRVYEDIATTHKFIFEAKRILMLPNELYYHVYRKDSIMHIRSIKNARDGFLSSLERAEYLKICGCAEDLYLLDVWSRSLTLLALAEPGNDLLFQHAEAVADSIPGIPPQLSRKKKFMLQVWKFDKRLFHLICRILGQKAPE